MCRNRGRGWFLANFVPNFLPFLAIESTLIYKGWKMDILYLIVPNRGLWFGWNGSHRWFKVCIVSCHICRKMVGWVGYFRSAPQPLWCQSAWTDYSRLKRNVRWLFACMFCQIWWMLEALNAPAKEVTWATFMCKKKKIMNSAPDDTSFDSFLPKFNSPPSFNLV